MRYGDIKMKEIKEKYENIIKETYEENKYLGMECVLLIIDAAVERDLIQGGVVWDYATTKAGRKMLLDTLKSVGGAS